MRKLVENVPKRPRSVNPMDLAIFKSSRAVQENLRNLRLGFSINREDFGKLCGVGGRTVNHWENGTYCIPAVKLQIVADHFHLKLKDFTQAGGVAVVRDPDHFGELKAISVYADEPQAEELSKDEIELIANFRQLRPATRELYRNLLQNMCDAEGQIAILTVSDDVKK